MTIQNKLTSLNQGIVNIKDEIIIKGESVSSEDTLASLSNKIENISNEKGDKYSRQVLNDIIEGTIEYLYDTTSIYLRPFLFTGCDKLNKAHFCYLRKIGRSAFYKCYNLKTLILDVRINDLERPIDLQIVELEDINAFKHTLIGKGLGKIYVPHFLYSDYLNDEKWSHFEQCFEVIDEYTH